MASHLGSATGTFQRSMPPLDVSEPRTISEEERV
ncbi:5488736d-3039-4041-985f-e8c8f107d72e [Thermothielavioides terrestris]|uniref:5488736d-3039-4041-985f-e8c8f107d72e n=1 Tax=Thermothielavioides terrestris TaxID=2587410 RepID=A0A446BGW7_9PEZI|nr:5488736d-3039-4041-985f-e8c8f107d72e [Thermothielavioides terrestris]